MFLKSRLKVPRMSVNSSLRILATGLASLAFVSSIRAQEFPSTGILFNTSEMQSLVYRCEQSAKNSLDCCVFRKSVTGLFGIVTDGFGNVTGHFGDVTEGSTSVF